MRTSHKKLFSCLTLFLPLYLLALPACSNTELMETLLKSNVTTMTLDSGKAKVISTQDKGKGILGKPVDAHVVIHITPNEGNTLEEIIAEISEKLTNDGWTPLTGLTGDSIGMVKKEEKYQLIAQYTPKSEGYVHILVREQ